MSSHATRTTNKFQEVTKGLKEITAHSISSSQVHIENPIGSVQVPVGLAGPLLVQEIGKAGEQKGEEVYAPLATTEAALIASCSRGCKAFSRSGGVHITSLSDTMTPAFKFDSPTDALLFAEQIPTFNIELKRIAETTSRHLRLLSVTPTVMGSETHLKFNYACGDAAGQNMATIATHHACREMLLSPAVAQLLKIRGFLIEAGLSADKKGSWSHLMEPRGVEVMAWGSITDEAAREVLGCTSEAMYKGISQLQSANIRAGVHGNSINAMNIVTALFIATGQDVASIAEACWNQLVPEYNNETKVITLSLYIPSLPVAIVGGGTHLGPQREALELMNCSGPGRKGRLAALIAAFALALEVSTAGALHTDTFTQAHKGLRRKPVGDNDAKL
ncbi:hmg-CoA reductase [Aspergillus vadensis CBS 113365]|uniref:Hmg-CoA reductase n=1 Tax=Aspergillus vadensis (strain CBS 113365 / IMI 142717 / IBT 24658) TaxID=1448311 RepID=A0A319AVM3_ASPVC|nr:hmg-CoA reductase [Aspergillus vadensis CBS 113365]PYH64309.1 hmg-CoA reductase [Aspergillus vadensis CBS 113365]